MLHLVASYPFPLGNQLVGRLMVGIERERERKRVRKAEIKRDCERKIQYTFDFVSFSI